MQRGGHEKVWWGTRDGVGVFEVLLNYEPLPIHSSLKVSLARAQNTPLTNDMNSYENRVSGGIGGAVASMA